MDYLGGVLRARRTRLAATGTRFNANTAEKRMISLFHSTYTRKAEQTGVCVNNRRYGNCGHSLPNMSISHSTKACVARVVVSQLDLRLVEQVGAWERTGAYLCVSRIP